MNDEHALEMHTICFFFSIRAHVRNSRLWPYLRTIHNTTYNEQRFL